MPCFAILGHPVSHSLSPKFHNAEFKKQGLKNYVYELYDCPPEKLSEAIDKIRRGEYQGYSVTIPLKEAVMPYVDELSPIARRVGAVNTIVRREDGTLFGDNTDYEGFRISLEEEGVLHPKSEARNTKQIPNSKFQIPKNALVLGTGGASKAVVAVLLDQGWKVTVGTRGKKTVSSIEYRVFRYEELNPCDDYQLIVNTTPVGMAPDIDSSLLTDSAWFKPNRIYVDVIYTPKMTKFLKLAKASNAKIITGDRMFYWQAMAQAEEFISMVHFKR